MSAHDWIASGRMDDGSQRMTCATCGIGRTWPEAKMRCGAAFADGRLRAVVPLTPALLAAVVAPAPPCERVRYPGPYAAEPERPCKRCGDPYVRPLRMGHSAYCGPTCAQAEIRATRRRSARKMRAAE